MPVYIAHAIPFAEGAVIALAACGFGRWRFTHPEDRYGRLLWLGGILAAVVAGIDAWNWLPGWPHQYPWSPWGQTPGQPPPPLPTPFNIGVLVQGFLLPPWWHYLGPGHVVPDWADGPSLWLGQAYLSAGVATVLGLAYAVGARQFARLRRALPVAAGWGAGLLLLRVPALLDAVWLRIHHLSDAQSLFLPPPVSALARWVIAPQVVVVLLALPAIALISARWVERPAGASIRR